MIVLRINSGLANQMYSFCAAYALSRARNEPLAIDISASIGKFCGYQLDFFSLPQLDKIAYFLPEEASHTRTEGMPARLLEHGECYSDVNDTMPSYGSLADAGRLHGDPIILCGYFFTETYYLPYWRELLAIFTPRKKCSALDVFDELAKGHETVGIHIRRGDFLVTDYAFLPGPDYFRAAVTYYRQRLKDPRFFIFSDDIAYAEEILGKDSSFYYVHPLGQDTGPIIEFLCLSRCTHKILSNDSTFSSLAYKLNQSEEKTAVVCKKEIKDTFDITDKLGLQQLQQCRTGYIEFSAYAIKVLSQHYSTDGKNSCSRQQERAAEAIAAQDDAQAVAQIERIFFTVYGIDEDMRTRLAWRKMQAHAALQQYDEALDLAYGHWSALEGRAAFHALYGRCLYATGFPQEAAIELSRQGEGWEEGFANDAALCAEVEAYRHCPRSRFVMVPAGRVTASSCWRGIISLAVALRRLGHRVDLLLRTGSGEDCDEGERYFIHKNSLLTTRAGICLGCGQAVYEEVAEAEGIAKFLAARAAEGTVLISDALPELQCAESLHMRRVVLTDTVQKSTDNEALYLQKTAAQKALVTRKPFTAKDQWRLAVHEIGLARQVCAWLDEG